MTYHAVIVEDNKADAELIQAAFARYCPNVVIDAVVNSVTKALTAIRKYNPAFIVLDVELGDRLGFEVLDALDEMEFETLFVSAHNVYMREAFLASAVDFLEKPYSDELFIEAVNRTISKIATSSNRTVLNKLEQVLQHIKAPMVLNAKLRLSNMEGIHTVPINEIVYIEAQNNRAKFYLANSLRPILVSKTLGDFEEQLEPYNFICIQKSFIVNMEHIAIYKKSGDVIMKCYEDKELGMGKDYREEFNNRYYNYTIGS